MKSRYQWTVLPAFVLILALTGCRGNNQQGTGQPPASSESTSNAGNTAQPPANQAAPPQAQTAPPEPPPPREETITVPEGATLQVRLATPISSGTAAAGSEFEGTLAAPLITHGVTVAPRGSTVSGRVSNAVSSGRLNRPAELGLTLSSLTLPSGRTVEISTTTWSQKGQSHKKRNAAMIGGGAGVGALVGAIAGKGKGAAIGAMVGGGAGTAGAAVTGKKEIVLPAETKLTFSLTAPFSFKRKRA